MNWTAALKLGRVSNLPTVWTNVLVGVALVSADYDIVVIVLAAAAMSCMHVAGMFLNDAFDVDWDRQHGADRPIVRGEASRREVVVIGVVLIAVALGLIGWASGGQRPAMVASGAVALVGLILLYDWKHKQWSFSPWLMGGCRMAVYLTAAALVGAWNQPVIVAGLCLLAYIAGITYAARAEHLNSVNTYWPMVLLFLPPVFVVYLGYDQPRAWLIAGAVLVWLVRAAQRLIPGESRNVPAAVGSLLAGIALIDAAILTALDRFVPALIAVAAFVLCLILQRRIAAT